MARQGPAAQYNPGDTGLWLTTIGCPTRRNDGETLIQLDVTLDDTLLRRFRDDRWAGLEAGWHELCQRYSMDGLSRFEDFFHCDRQATLDDPTTLDGTAAFLCANLRQSVEHITRWMPELPQDIVQSLTVAFLPHDRYTFSPKLGLQFFSLDPDADRIETYLFLVHVYYLELSSLNETPHESRCSSEQTSAEDFKDWIRLLIRNEGIGNYAILEDLIQFRDSNPGYTMRYFSYARQISNRDVLQGAISILTNVFAGVNDQNATQFSADSTKSSEMTIFQS